MPRDEKLEAVYESSVVDIYTAINMVMLEYPYRLETVNDSSPTVASKVDNYILDSNIFDESVMNEDVLDRATHLDAQRVMPADILGEPAQTVDRVVDFYSQLADREFECEVLIPLQSNDVYTHTDCYYMMQDALQDIGVNIDENTISIGGVVKKAVPEQFEIVSSVREELGMGVDIHALGLGCSGRWMKILRRCPWLIESLDMSSPVKAAKSGNIIDMNMQTQSLETPRGTKSTTLSSHLIEYILLMMNYMMSDLPRDEDIVNEIVDETLEAAVSKHELWHSLETDGVETTDDLEAIA